MGLTNFFSTGSEDTSEPIGAPSKGTVEPPDKRDPTQPSGEPYACEGVRSEEINGGIVVELRYEKAENYDGRKIMVFENAEAFWKTYERGQIDPHFLEADSMLSPVARFEPTARGWRLAIELLENQ